MLEGLGAPVSPEALGPAYLPPKTDGSGNIRNQLEEAGKLLDQAGWTMKDGKRVNAKGEQMKLEILNFEPAFERVTAPFVKNLQLLGIDASMRMVDPAQYQRRLKTFDFDITTERYTMRNTPAWSCAAISAPTRRRWTDRSTSPAFPIRLSTLWSRG